MNRRGVNAATLARNAGVNEGQLSGVLKGVKMLGRDSVARAAVALSVPVGWLYLGEGEPPDFAVSKDSTGLGGGHSGSLQEPSPPLPPSDGAMLEDLLASLSPSVLRDEIERYISRVEKDPADKRALTMLRLLLSEVTLRSNAA